MEEGKRPRSPFSEIEEQNRKRANVEEKNEHDISGSFSDAVIQKLVPFLDKMDRGDIEFKIEDSAVFSDFAAMLELEKPEGPMVSLNLMLWTHQCNNPQLEMTLSGQALDHFIRSCRKRYKQKSLAGC